MKSKKSIGILTDPSKTFKMIVRNRVLQFQYNQLPEEFKKKKQSFMDFFGGNFQEINTLINELSSKGNISVVLYLHKNLFISQNYRISPYELTHLETIKEYYDFEKWINGKDVLIISLNKQRLKEFIDIDRMKILRDRLCVISAGKSTINELKQFQDRIIFVPRKGVARFGADNRQKILTLLS